MARAGLDEIPKIPLVQFKNKTAEPLSSKAIAANEEITNFVESPKQPETGSLVSPSPLVSWRADCTVERGKQLFLLTPLPISKTLSSRSQGTSRPAFERINDMDPPNTTIGPPPSLTISKNKNDDLLEKLELKPTPNKYPRSPVTQMEGTLGCGLITASRFLKKDHSMFLMTPCLKMSPPKSCLLLEPISESSHRVNDEFPKSTSFVVGIENCVSENLVLKYPELFGPQPPHKWGTGRKEVQTSPGRFISPPQTCVLMEPPDKMLPMHSAAYRGSSGIMLDEQASLKAKRGKEHFGPSLGLLESTPMWKESDSRELWTKFEAATTNSMHFNISIFRETGRKGFLDRLEEVSCEEAPS
uniref:Uncharacterized protein n=1 Tax=Nelumbo nucifera TaxID=4432 RepID=A0A822ZM37_NELNU|nr:TPA_asm: hypothetical protein HUJ06_002821 [Nelumbo nucifera]